MVNKNKPYCILVVEDNPGDFVLLKQFLKKSELPVGDIVHAEKINEVPSIITDTSFDIVLLDLTLPDSKGVDSVITLERLLSKVPIVVFSGLSTIEIAIESISLGAQDYLIKGEFDEKLLTKTIQYSIERKRATEKLRESNEKYELVNKATLDIIWEWDYYNNEGTWGEGFCQTFGYSTDQLRYDLTWIEKYIHPDDQDGVVRSIQFCIDSRIKNWQHEYRFRCVDGTYKEVFDRGYIVYDQLNMPHRMIGAMTDITEKKELERGLAAQKLKQQKMITEVTIQAQEKERNELGKELHDNINQILAIIKMYTGIAKDKDDIPRTMISECYDLVTAVMEEIRKLSHSLVTPSLGDIGLLASLRDLADDINKANKVKVKLLGEEFYARLLDSGIELMLYRVIQEQVSNILKYSKAVNAVISLEKDDKAVYLTISDDGVGFDPGKTSKGIGLKNIQSRIDYYNGSLTINSSPGNGCTLSISIPVNDIN